MKPDILRYRTEFTLDEVARQLAGVETEMPENREDVISAQRLLLGAIRKFQLIADAPDSVTDVVPLRTETGDYNYDSAWRSALITREQLEEWFAREKWPLPPWLAFEAISSAPPSNLSGHSPEALLRIIVALVVLLTEKSGFTYNKIVKPREKFNVSSLHAAVLSALESIKASTKGVGQSQFYDIFNEDFCGEIIKALYPEE